MYSAVATGEVDVITAFSTDGRIPAFDLVLLRDTRNVLPPYDAVLLIGPDVWRTVPGLARVLQPLREAIAGDAMRAANRQVDVDGDAIAEAVERLRGRMRVAP
ncbi:hypothetical protein BH24PSE2_BH24PSE2_01540 [soil metagenome]